MVDDLFKENIKLEEAAKLLKLKQSDATLPQGAAAASARESAGLQEHRPRGWTNDIDCYLRDGGYEQLKKALGDEAARTSSTR